MAENFDAHFPDDPEFYRRVLHYAPTPLLVVRADATVVYANRAMLDLGGWEFVAGQSALDFIHPDDKEFLAQAFLRIVESPSARVLGGRPWPEIHVRAQRADGTTTEVVVYGTGAVLDDAVKGMIYAVRPARARNLMSQVLSGLSNGASVSQMLSHVCEIIAAPPLDLDSVILQSDPAGGYSLAATNSSELAAILRSPLDEFWRACSTTPKRFMVEDMPAAVSSRLSDIGFEGFWATAVESPLTPSTLRILAASPTRHDPDRGVFDRIGRAQEVAAAILLRTQTDALLQYAAATDALTGLPNRFAFYQQSDALDIAAERAALHLSLNGLDGVSEVLGQATEDAGLQIIADRMRAICNDHDLIGRVDGNEFSIVLVATESQPIINEHAHNIATGLRQALNEPIVIGGRPLNLSARIGYAVAHLGESTGQLLVWAQAALEHAKTGNDGSIVKFDQGFG